MAKRRISRKRQKRNRKKWVVSPQVPLCALGEVLRSKSVFAPLHARVNIPQKTVHRHSIVEYLKYLCCDR